MTSYKKMLLRNTLAICLLFSFLFTLSFYIERYFSSKKEYLGNAQQNLNEIMDKLDAASLHVQDLSVIFHSSPDFQEYVESQYVSPYLSRTITTYIRTTIATLSSASGTIAVTRPNDNQIIATNSTMALNYFFYHYGLPVEDVEDIMSSAKNLNSSTPYVFFSSANEKTYFTVLFVDSSSFTEPYLIFNVYDFEKILSGMERNASILISDVNNTPLYYSEQLSQRDVNRILNKKRVFKYSTIANSTKTFTSFGKLTCTIVLPKTKYISDINHHLLFTLLSFLILFLLSIFISQRVSDKTYSPIQKLVDQISSLDASMPEDEIDAISSVISILSKRNTALTSIVANNRTELKEKFINDLLHGYLTDEQVSYGIKSYLSNSKQMLPLAVVITDLHQDIAKAAMESELNSSSLNLVIGSVFRQEFENDGFFHFTVLSPTSYCTVVSCSNIETLKARLRRLLLTIESDLNFDMYSSVSDFVKDWKELPTAFLSTYFAHTTLKSQEISQTVYSRDEINNPILYSYEVDNEIFSHCLRREREQLEKSLDFLVKENFTSQEDFTKRETQMSVLIFALCMRILTSINADSETVFGKDYNIYLELRSCQNSEDFRKLLGFIFGNIIEFIEKSQSLYEQSYYDRMLGFLHENYSTNISLVDLAEYMNMSQSYVSRLFKKLTNFNFKDYLSKVRIEQSTKLLVEHPEKSIQEISTLVGFNTVKTFSAIFLKLTGMTPSEYRRVHTNKDNA